MQKQKVVLSSGQKQETYFKVSLLYSFTTWHSRFLGHGQTTSWLPRLPFTGACHVCFCCHLKPIFLENSSRICAHSPTHTMPCQTSSLLCRELAEGHGVPNWLHKFRDAQRDQPDLCPIGSSFPGSERCVIAQLNSTDPSPLLAQHLLALEGRMHCMKEQGGPQIASQGHT